MVLDSELSSSLSLSESLSPFESVEMKLISSEWRAV